MIILKRELLQKMYNSAKSDNGGMRTSVPSKAVCRKIGPALWEIGSTGFVRMSEKMPFLDNLASYQPKLMILAQEPF